MCRRPSVGAVGAILTTCSLGLGAGRVGVAAQQPSEAELVRRVEALLPEYEAARAARDERLRAVEAEEAEARRRQPTPLDTVQVGPMRIVTRPDEVDAARDLFTRVWRDHFPWVTESPSLRAVTFVYQWRARLQHLDVAPRPDGYVASVDISRVWAPTRAHAEAFVANAIARVIVQDFPQVSPMRTWLTAQSSPDGETVYRALAAGTSGASRACMTGEVPACMASLGLGLRAGSQRLPAWFTDQERRGMVQEAAHSLRVDWDDTRYRRCVEENDARACDPILAELDWVARPAGSDRLRAHLLWFAAREGGEGAWQRALERSDAPMPEVLAHVAGRPIEQLVADWRTDVLARRPDVHAGLGGRGTRALLWSLIFTVLAMRSTRWRLA